MANNFGSNLRDYVQSKELHQGILAREALISKGQLSKIFHGRSNVYIDDAIAILEVLDVTLEYVMSGNWTDSSMGKKCKIPKREVPKTAFKKGENGTIRRRNKPDYVGEDDE